MQLSSSSPTIYSHDFADVLTHNETYLRAVQRAGISIYNLGFENLEFPGLERPLSRSPHKGRKCLQAIVPKDGQIDFLDSINKSLIKAGVFVKSSQHKQNKNNINKKKQPPGRPYSACAKLQAPQSSESSNDPAHEEGQGEGQRKLPNRGKLVTTGLKPKRWSTVPQEVSAARPVRRMLEQHEKELELAKEIEREKLKQKKIGERFDLIDADGDKYVYDLQGRRVKESEFEKQKQEMEETSKLIEASSHVDNGRRFTGAIIEKTTKYVDAIRERVTWVGISSVAHVVCLCLSVSVCDVKYVGECM
jgi:hypothetical protein